MGIALWAMFSLASASIPGWWQTRPVVEQGVDTNDFAIANLGQLMNIAYQAYEEMEDVYAHAGGAGQGVRQVMTNDFAGVSNAFSALNLGQLKKVAQPYYDRLIEFGEAVDYPWSSTSVTNDYALANIGQVKHLFSFDVLVSTNSDFDADGMADLWEVQIINAYPHDGLDVIQDILPTDDFDQDLVSNLAEFQASSDPLHAASDTLYVDAAVAGPGIGSFSDPYPTIAAALTAAVNGQTVAVQEGIYTGAGNVDLSFQGKDITVEGLGDPRKVIVDGQGASRVFVFETSETRSSVLQKLTIVNGRPPVDSNGGYLDAGDGGGILIDGASPTIQQCYIHDCEADLGAAIRVRSGAPLLAGNFLDNNMGRDGAAVAWKDSTSGEMVNNVICANAATDAAVVFDTSVVNMINNSIIGNQGGGQGGGECSCRL